MELCPQRSVKYGQVFGGSKPPPYSMVLLIIGLPATTRGRRDWDDVGIVPYDLYRKLTAALASFGKGGGTAKP